MNTIIADLNNQLDETNKNSTQELSSEFLSKISAGMQKGGDFYLNCEPGSGCGGSGEGFLKG